MRCLSCDKNLTDFEATRKSVFSGEFIDLCNRCFASVSDDLQTIDRPDLLHDEADDFEQIGTDEFHVDKTEDL